MHTSLPVETPLAQLEGADLIRRIRELETTYQFKHNLIQESAYASLLRNDRRTLHRACAQAIESGFPQDLDENAAVLARHYNEAGDQPKTFEYALRAGDAAIRVHALSEALTQYETGFALAAHLPLTTSELLDVYQKRGRVLELLGRYPDAVATYRALETLGKARGDAALEIGALLSLGTLYTFPNQAQDLAEALRVNEVVLALVRATHNEPAEARALWNRQQYSYFTGHPDEAVAYSQQALVLAERLGLDDLRAYILNDASRALTSVESVPAALQALAKAGELWRKSGNLPMLVDNLSSTADAALAGGKIQLAEEFVRESLTLSQTIGNLWNLAYGSTTLMQIYAGRGEMQRALETGVQAVRLGTESGFLIAGMIAEIQRAGIYAELGDPARGLELLHTISPNESFHFFESWRLGTIALLELLRHNLPAVHTAIAQVRAFGETLELSSYGPIYMGLGSVGLALEEGRYTDTIDEISALAERMRMVQMRFLLPDLLLLQGKAHLALHAPDKAEQVLQEAEQLAREMETRPRLWQILEALAKIETLGNNVERAAAFHQEAREILHQLAALAPEEFRAPFLAQPGMRAVLDA